MNKIINYDPTGNYKIKHSRPVNFVPPGTEPKVNFKERLTETPSIKIETKQRKKEIKKIDVEIKKSEE